MHLYTFYNLYNGRKAHMYNLKNEYTCTGGAGTELFKLLGCVIKVSVTFLV